MTLSLLPVEILQHIAVFVQRAHRPSLHNFTLTSKACHRASLFLVFRKVCIAVNDRKRLQRDVDLLIGVLSHTDSSRHVQHLTIKGALTLGEKKTETRGRKTPWLVTTGLDEVLDEEPVDYGGIHTVYDEGVIEKSSEEDMAWGPVVKLLQATNHLKDLVYDCHSQFPPSLLDVLHKQLPRCRLHHLTFRFRTLLWGTPYAYEMELATSPNLYRVNVGCSPRDSDGDDDFNLEAVMELVTGLAPNLTEVVIFNLCPGRSLSYIRPRASWQGLPGFTGGKIGSLTSLSIKGYSRLSTPEMLQNWARVTDFACLQHLSLGGSYGAQTCGLSGETMEWVARNQFFPQLKTLGVYLDRDDLSHERPHYNGHAVSFFQAFEPLEGLSVHGPITPQIMTVILSHHGRTLRKLSLHPFENLSANTSNREQEHIAMEFTKDRVLQIQSHCPVLEDLAITVKRNKSSAYETEIYECFGTFNSLRSLFLVLDCSNWRILRDPTYSPAFEGEDQDPVGDLTFPFLKKGELKETFINCAVDEALARSIWNTVSKAKTGRRLDRLKLWPTGEGQYGGSYAVPSTFLGIVQNLARSWLLERVPRIGTDDFTIVELGQNARKARDQEKASYLAYRHNPEIWEVLFSLWPACKISKDWRDGWSSSLLQFQNPHQ